jgi:hypothetical protein
VVSSSFQGFQYTYRKLGAGAVTNPLLDSTMLCVEGVAVLVRGEQLDAPSSSRSLVPAASIDSEAGDSTSSESELIPEDQYLCTGLDLYVTYEPDLMTCMALVHSRIRRVYFREVDPEHGALSSHYSFHSLRALNHHYRVFRVVPTADA